MTARNEEDQTDISFTAQKRGEEATLRVKYLPSAESVKSIPHDYNLKHHSTVPIKELSVKSPSFGKKFLKQKPSFRGSGSEDDSQKAFASWVSVVVDKGTGYIEVDTPTGKKKFIVREASAEDAPAAAEPLMHPDVAKAIELARGRGAQAVARITGHDDMLSGEALGKLMGITRQAVDKARKSGSLIAVDSPKRGLHYPAWQLDEYGYRRIGLQQVLTTVGEGWDAYRFFMTEQHDVLNRDLLVSGDVRELLSRAKMSSSEAYT